MIKTLEEDDMSSLIIGDGPQEERFHWSVMYDDNLPVPQCSAGGIMIKVRPLPIDKEKKEPKPFSYGEEIHFQEYATSSLEEGKMKSKTNPSLFCCTYPGCNKTFNKSWRLKSHMRNHTGEKKPHPCSVDGCDKSFNDSQALKNHMRVHTGEKPFQCTFENCDKRFSEKGNLRKHMRIHTGEKPYSCNFEGCRKSFGRSEQLKVHLAEHTGVKPYRCPVEGCEKSFSYASGLKVHHRAHHQMGC